MENGTEMKLCTVQVSINFTCLKHCIQYLGPKSVEYVCATQVSSAIRGRNLSLDWPRCSRRGKVFTLHRWPGVELPSGEWTVKHSNLTLTGQKSTLNLSVTTASAGVTSFLYDGDLHRIFAFAIIDRRVIH